MRRFVLKVEKAGEVLAEHAFTSREEITVPGVDVVDGAYIVLEGRTPAGKLLAKGKVGPIDLSRARANGELTVTMFFGDVRLFTPFAESSLGRVDHRAARLPNADVLITGGDRLVSLDVDLDGDGRNETIQQPRSSSTYEVLSLQTLELTTYPNRVDFSPAPRTKHQAVVLPDNRVVLVGGASRLPTSLNLGIGDYRNDVEIFDPDEVTIQARAALAFGRWDHSATLLPDGRILVAGGRGGEGKGSLPGSVLAHAELLEVEPKGFVPSDPSEAATRTTALEPGPTCARAGHSAAYVPSVGRVLLVGGVDSTGTATDCVEAYIPEERRFEKVEMVSSDGSTVWRGRTGIATAYSAARGELYLVGGAAIPRDSADQPTGTARPVNFLDVLTFDLTAPHRVTFERVPMVLDSGTVESRAQSRAAFLPDGRLLIVGGEAIILDQVLPARAWLIFDPATRRFSSSGDQGLTEARRMGHSLAVLPNGEVLVIGGEVASDRYAKLVEWYTPEEGS
ncbi:MAG: hypothetical protein HYY13_04495 [Nitrospirae bacterium]|nr:hypothetical protein [Nitrospirota bacterium]